MIKKLNWYLISDITQTYETSTEFNQALLQVQINLQICHY